MRQQTSLKTKPRAWLQNTNKKQPILSSPFVRSTNCKNWPFKNIYMKVSFFSGLLLNEFTFLIFPTAILWRDYRAVKSIPHPSFSQPQCLQGLLWIDMGRCSSLAVLFSNQLRSAGSSCCVSFGLLCDFSAVEAFLGWRGEEGLEGERLIECCLPSWVKTCDPDFWIKACGRFLYPGPDAPECRCWAALCSK